MTDKERQRERIERLMARRETLVEAERRTAARHADLPSRPVGGIRPRIHSDTLSRQEQLWAEKLRGDN